jgi:hypothetical protein
VLLIAQRDSAVDHLKRRVFGCGATWLVSPPLLPSGNCWTNVPVVARLDSRLEAQGAEFLVLGQLLVAGVQAYKAYTNYPGYDLVAISKDGQRTCRVQVKSRWATDWDRGLPIKNFDCDFVVLVALNRGTRYQKKRGTSDDVRPPEFWVFRSLMSGLRKTQRAVGGRSSSAASTTRIAFGTRGT